MNYEDYHTHPVNKFIHAICIPLIVLSTCNLLSKIKIHIGNDIKLEISEFQMFAMLIYYLTQSFVVFFLMSLYFFMVLTIAYIWRFRKNYMYESACVFIISWILQFLGHAIEGNRPALLDSLTQTFIEAPVFSLSYILPIKLSI